MCRLLAIRTTNNLEISHILSNFAEAAKNSKEYQGHGWGISYLDDGSCWKTNKNVNPIWEEDTFEHIPQSKMYLVHARSAFKDEGITVENNMPFTNGQLCYIFNGELRGVRIRQNGRIGAEKIFNLIQNLNKNDLENAVERTIKVLKNRTEYIRGLNFIISDKSNFYISNYHNEDNEYFNLNHAQDGNTTLVCSDKILPSEFEWRELQNYNTMVI